ncbi:uncharacterized protein BXIN_1976 [Babesia sp. Xinjiang]|uniref:uncharacterized protein n=1 Tax=Babesia sp. Xinjiang TaxID=462227 RepID=UPI000A2189F5|nr:uncharacterized protein BXIN_1976 [Babesia sp. Xinjiang]ORM40585.1 hypothetical protein BXIN_1976 [Babesia sp. Xinjiang]
MINLANERFEQLKQNLRKLNSKKHKKRVGETRMHLTQYLAHVLPLASQRLILAPIYRACVAYQGGNQSFYRSLQLLNATPFSILGGLYDSIGFRRLWSLARIHIFSGAVFPAVLIGTRSVSGQGVYPRANDSLGSGYMGTVMLCNFAHLFSYPFDVAYGRFVSTLGRDVSLRRYFNEVYTEHGFGRLYSGYSLCVASTALHLLVALSLNDHLQGKLKERLSYQIERNPVLNSTIRPLEPSELKPIEMFPWNIIFGSFSAFIARTVTYPLDTMRIRYQQETWHHKGRTSFNNLASSIRASFRAGISKLYAGYPVSALWNNPKQLLSFSLRASQ